MGDELVALVLFSFLGLLVLLAIGAVRGWIALSRTNDLARRLERAEEELAGLRAREVRGDRPQAAPRPASAPSEPPVPAAPMAPSAGRAPGAPAAPPPVPPAPPVPLVSPGPAAPAREPSAAMPPPAPQPADRAGSPETAGEWGSRAAARTLPSAPRAAPGTPRAPRAKFEWERWLGVRGAAVLGGISLIVAGFLFLQYSIERGWVTPEVRLAVGAVTGVACLAIQHFLRRRGYAVLSNSLAGAGIVILYAVAWASHRLYGVLEFLPAFAAMVLVTALCAVLAYRYASQLVAVLGLVGGFATPIALSTGSDRPVALFGYALLLDLGFLFVAHKRRWPGIGLVALAGTFVIQGLWIARRMDAASLGFAIGVLAVFGLLFAVVSVLRPSAERRQWLAPQVGALLLPFAYALYFAQHIEFGRHLAPLALLAGALTIAGGVLARLQGTPWISLGTVSGALSLILVWTFGGVERLDGGLALELVVVSLGLAAIQLAFAEWERRKAPGQRGATFTAAIACLGLVIACGYACSAATGVPLARWLPALVLLPCALLLLHSFGAHVAATALACFASGAALAIRADSQPFGATDWQGTRFALLVLALGLILLAGAWRVRVERRRSAFFAVAAYFPCALAAIAWDSGSRPVPPAQLVAGLFATGLAFALAANGARSASLFALAVFFTFVAHSTGAEIDFDAQVRSAAWATQVAVVAAGVAAYTLWPFLAPTSMAARAGAWRVGASAAVLWCAHLHDLWVERHGGAYGFAVPLASALVLGFAARALWRRGEPELDAAGRAAIADPTRAETARVLSVARCWYGAFALLYASLALPLHFDPRPEQSARHPLAVAAALFACALAAWWRRSDHRGLKYAAAGFGGLAALVLASSAFFDVHVASDLRVFNERGYWLLLPAVATLVAAVLVAARERARMRGLEARLAPRACLPATAVLSVAGLLLAFAWLNVEVADAFAEELSTGRFARWSLRGSPRAGLATSIAWAVFALALLGAGVARKLGALRWGSLVLFLATIAKVFLLDLAHLRGLYRVAAIFGLALSLFLVSFLYQRFVFRPAKRAAGESD